MTFIEGAVLSIRALLPPFVSIILPGRIRLSLTAEMMLVVDSGVNALWIEVCRDVIY